MLLPSVAELLGRVTRHPALEESLDAIRSGVPLVGLVGLSDPAKALVAAQSAASLHRPILFVVTSNQRAEMFLEPARFFLSALSGAPSTAVAVLPALDVLPWQGLAPHPQILEARAATLWRLTTGHLRIVIVPVAAALLRMREPEFYAGLARTLVRDQETPREELVAHLASVGYERHEMVEMPGQFAVRGGILDVFPPEGLRPIRAEFFGDTVESLREFDAESQRSIMPLERVILPPLTEFPRLEAQAEVNKAAQEDDSATRQVSFAPGWEFHPALWATATASVTTLCDSLLLLLEEPDALEEAALKFRAALEDASQRAEGEVPGEPASPTAYYLTPGEWQGESGRLPRLLVEHLALDRSAAEEWPARHITTQPTTRYHGNVAAFMAEVRSRTAAGDQVIISAGTTGELERLADLCREYELTYRLGEVDEKTAAARLAEDPAVGSISAMVLVRAPIAEGVVFPECRLVIYGTGDLFEALPAVAHPPSRAKTAGFFSDFSELKPGDFVVHVDHGIGRFEGLRQLESGNARGEFMHLLYAEEARLYVPLERLDLVQSYRTLGGAAPQLDRLGGTGWVARKARVRKSLADMADHLLGLYAERKTVEGFGFSRDTPWQKEFEDAFAFEETPDQATAIADVKRDMERPAPMDRLLCGDVGYGKTEVAMRAAFKAVSDSKQVAVLAPTTVLVFQHYETFKQRFAAFPMRIEMLSRFRTAREQKDVLAALESGQVDVVIGTHRLLSRDVRFHDLGLLVVDEEQRFGVAHKERIKEMRKNVDVLTLSATPIPRTLHMSLVGLRDMSVIESPPKDRLAIQTVVTPFQESIVRRAIDEELARGGQVFFVHNRVESIHSLAH